MINNIQSNTLSHRNNFVSKEGISDAELHKLVPSAFAEYPSGRVSSKYKFIATTQSIQMLRDHYWYPVNAFQQRSKTENRLWFTKHVIVFRHPDFDSLEEDEYPELILENSHNASASYKVHAGIFRTICSNGLIVADETFNTLVVRHSGTIDQVLQGTKLVAQRVPTVFAKMNRMKARPLSPAESRRFAEEALALRYKDISDIAITPETVLRRRRERDEQNSLWTHLNVVQENLLRGGVRSDLRKPNKLSAIIPVRSLSRQIELNKGLWKLAEMMLN